MQQPPSGTPRLRSQSGAFDLPSILVGVVVVGILTAGVMAAVFGVIPWAQDRSAKQDLAAINTAQGVTYAKDGQTYKDLTGLGNAGLVSDLDPETTVVATYDVGKRYSASVVSGSGRKWCITNEDTAPRDCTETEPGNAAPDEWAGAFCSPELQQMADAGMGMYLDPGILEYFKFEMKMDYDEAALAAWMEYMSGPPPYDPDVMDPELVAAMYDMNYALARSPFLEEIFSIPEAGVEDWPAMHAKAVEHYDAAGLHFCSSYTGPVADLEEHPSHNEAFDYRKHALTGSQDPVVLGYTFEFGDKSTYDFTVSGTEGLAGFKSASHGFEIVDGEPYWTTVLSPGASGWGESAASANLTVTASRKSDTDKVHTRTRAWETKANPHVIRIAPASASWVGIASGYNDSWDHQVRHIGSRDTEVYYGIEQAGRDPDQPEKVVADDYWHELEITSMTPGMNASVKAQVHGFNGHHADMNYDLLSTRIEPQSGEVLASGTVSFTRKLINIETFARTEHAFSYTSSEPVHEEPKMSVVYVDNNASGSSSVTSKTMGIAVDNGYVPADYRFELEYAGEPIDAGGFRKFQVGPTTDLTISSSNAVRDKSITSDPDRLRVHLNIRYTVDDYYRENVDFLREVTVKATYIPTGESSTIKVKLP